MRLQCRPLLLAVALLCSEVGCVHLHSRGVDVDVTLDKSATSNTDSKSGPKADPGVGTAKANAPAKVDAQPKVDGAVRLVSGKSEPSTNARYRNRSGSTGKDGVFDVSARLQPAGGGRRVNDTAISTPTKDQAVESKSEPVEDSGLASNALPPPPPAAAIPESAADAPTINQPDALTLGGAVGRLDIGDLPGLATLPAGPVETASPIERGKSEGNAQEVVPGTNPPVAQVAEAESHSRRTVPRAKKNPTTTSDAGRSTPEGIGLTGKMEIDSETLLTLLAAGGPAGAIAPTSAAGEPANGEKDADASSKKSVELNPGIPSAVASAPATALPSTERPQQPVVESRPAEVVAASALEVVPVAPVFQTVAGNATDADSKSPKGLELSRLHLCSEIHGFGDTVPMPSGPLRAGQQALAYVEVKGFASRPTGNGFETRLGCQMTLEDSSNTVVWQQDFGEVVDVCHDSRRDFFCHFVFTVPGDVAAGGYLLRLRMLDTVAPSAGEESMRVEVGSPR